jgi:hypothetical protein
VASTTLAVISKVANVLIGVCSYPVQDWETFHKVRHLLAATLTSRSICFFHKRPRKGLNWPHRCSLSKDSRFSWKSLSFRPLFLMHAEVGLKFILFNLMSSWCLVTTWQHTMVASKLTTLGEIVSLF